MAWREVDMDFLAFRSKAIQSLSLLQVLRLKDNTCEDEIEAWIKKEYDKYYNKEKEKDNG